MKDMGLQSLTNSELINLIIERAKKLKSCASSISSQLLHAVDEMEGRINIPLKAKHKQTVRGQNYHK